MCAEKEVVCVCIRGREAREEVENRWQKQPVAAVLEGNVECWAVISWVVGLWREKKFQENGAAVGQRRGSRVLILRVGRLVSPRLVVRLTPSHPGGERPTQQYADPTPSLDADPWCWRLAMVSYLFAMLLSASLLLPSFPIVICCNAVLRVYDLSHSS